MTVILLFVIACLMRLVFALLLAWPVQLLWNWLIPGIFGLGRITFLQAFGMELLAGFFLGGKISYKNEKTRRVNTYDKV